MGGYIVHSVLSIFYAPPVMRQPPDIGEKHSIFLVVVHVTAERHVC